MKAVLAVILFAVSAVAQDQSAIQTAEAACGPRDTKFEVDTNQTRAPVPQLEGDRALVYVIEDVGQIECKNCALTRVALDGLWVGANNGSSYFFFPASPGEHHLCLNWQSRLGKLSRAVALANFTADAGKVYYFRARIFLGRGVQYTFDLDQINSDQGKLLVASYPYSISHPRP